VNYLQLYKAECWIQLHFLHMSTARQFMTLCAIPSKEKANFISSCSIILFVRFSSHRISNTVCINPIRNYRYMMISFHHMHLHVCQLTSLHIISNVCPLSRNSINLVSSPDQPFQNVPQYPQCTQLDLPSTHYYFRGLRLFGSGYTSGSLSASNLKYS
jgi:hypothetical protein